MAPPERVAPDMELFADEIGSEGAGARPQPLRVIKRLGDRPGEVAGRGAGTARQVSGESTEQPDEPLVIMKKRGRHTPGPVALG